MTMVFRMRDLAKQRGRSSDITFPVWAAIVAIGLIVLSIAFGVDSDPAIMVFAAL